MTKRNCLKRSGGLAAIGAVTLALLATSGLAAPTQGLNERAMVQRAEEVTALKNTFVRTALEHAGLPYEADATGFPVRVQYREAWKSIQKIEVVPLTDPTAGEGGVNGHRVFFFTADDIFQIDSPLPVRK